MRSPLFLAAALLAALPGCKLLRKVPVEVEIPLVSRKLVGREFEVKTGLDYQAELVVRRSELWLPPGFPTSGQVVLDARAPLPLPLLAFEVARDSGDVVMEGHQLLYEPDSLGSGTSVRFELGQRELTPGRYRLRFVILGTTEGWSPEAKGLFRIVESARGSSSPRDYIGDEYVQRHQRDAQVFTELGDVRLQRLDDAHAASPDQRLDMIGNQLAQLQQYERATGQPVTQSPEPSEELSRKVGAVLAKLGPEDVGPATQAKLDAAGVVPGQVTCAAFNAGSGWIGSGMEFHGGERLAAADLARVLSLANPYVFRTQDGEFLLTTRAVATAPDAHPSLAPPSRGVHLFVPVYRWPVPAEPGPFPDLAGWWVKEINVAGPAPAARLQAEQRRGPF